MVECKICGKLCISNNGLSSHISRNHKIVIKDYYNKYIKIGNEDICPVCGKNTNFLTITCGYTKHCSSTCSALDKNTQDKRNDTYFNKTGYKHNSQNPTVKEQKELTCLKNHGATHQSKSEHIREKLRFSWKNKEAKELEIINKKRESTCLELYGEDNYSRTNDFKIHIRNVFNNKTTEELKISYAKGKATLKEKIGFEYPFQCKEIMKNQVFKTKETNIKNGRWISDDQLSNFELYYRRVLQNTYNSIINKYNADELKIRKPAGVSGGMHIDHKFSVVEGFKNNIIPSVIGSQSNIELIPWEDNLHKSSSCSITKEELFEQYEKEIKYATL